ncbi:MAG: hypothetical protein WA021_01145 [Minisyncoccia bacterium]
MIKIELSSRAVVGPYESKCDTHTDIDFRTTGTLRANYLFIWKAYSCLAAVQALKQIPCDVSISVRIVNGLVQLDGHILVLHPPAYKVAEIAVEAIAACAADAASESQKNRAGFSYTQQVQIVKKK